MHGTKSLKKTRISVYPNTALRSIILHCFSELVELSWNMWLTKTRADPSGLAVWGVVLRSLACWDCEFESRRGHGFLSLMSVLCYQVEVSASGWSLLQRSPTECGVSWVWLWILDNEVALACWGLLRHGKKKKEIKTMPFYYWWNFPAVFINSITKI